MGISAKKFGPVAWKFLESIASFCDTFIQREKSLLKQTLMRSVFARAMFSIGFVLPCVYCRFSFRMFTNPRRPLNASVDILNSVQLQDGCKKLVYNLHVAVNHKLEKQEIGVTSSAQVCAVHKKWTEYNISYSQALESRFGQRSVADVWVYFTTLLAFIICDYDVHETREHTVNLFASMCDMLALASETPSLALSCVFMEEIKSIRPLLDDKYSWKTKQSRRILAWKTHQTVLEAGGWSDRMATKSAIFRMCSAPPLCPRALVTIKKGTTKNVEKKLGSESKKNTEKQEKCSSKV